MSKKIYKKKMKTVNTFSVFMLIILFPSAAFSLFSVMAVSVDEVEVSIRLYLVSMILSAAALILSIMIYEVSNVKKTKKESPEE